MFTSSAFPGSTTWSRPPVNSGAEYNDSRRLSTEAANVEQMTPQQLSDYHKNNVMEALLAKFPQPSKLQVTMPFATAVYSVGGVYVSYTMQFKDENSDLLWQCTHRYSEFRTLHHHLGKSFASGFPPVMITNKGNRSKKEIESRRIRLEAYMKKVVSSVIDAYTGNLNRWANQHAAKIVAVATSEAEKHKGSSETSGGESIERNRIARGASPEAAASSSILSAVALHQYLTQLKQREVDGDRDDSFGGTPYSALVSMVPATMPPYLSQLTQLLRFIAHPYLEDWENVTFLAAPIGDDDRRSNASEIMPGSPGSHSRSPSFDSNLSTSRSIKSLQNSNAHPASVATRWRPPAVMPGPRLGLSMPLVTVSLSIESVWETHVKGDKGTKKGQLRHRYDEASAICAHIASKEHIMDSLQMQEFIMEFRRKHPIQAYLRFEKVLENHTPQTASRSDRISGGKTTPRQTSPRSSDPNGSSPLSCSNDSNASDPFSEIVGSPVSHHHRSLAGQSSESIHDSFPSTLVLATEAAGGVGVLYDPALDETAASVMRAENREEGGGTRASFAWSQHPRGAAAEDQFIDSMGLHFTLKPDYQKYSLDAVRAAKELEKRRRHERGANPTQSFMPKRSISILDTGLNTQPTRPVSPALSKSNSLEANLVANGRLQAPPSAHQANRLDIRTLPSRSSPIPTACAEYIARIKGPEVEECRCTDGQFCSNASPLPTQCEADEGTAPPPEPAELGDVYVTQSGYSIVVCPPPVPKAKSGNAAHGSRRD